MKTILLGIFLVCLNTICGTSFDTITKYLSLNSLKWYHFYSIGGISALIFLFCIILFFGGIKKNIVLKKKEDYLIPITRGITFIPIPIMCFYALKNIPISLFTTILMTTPFFSVIFSYIILKEKLNFITWIAVFFGFFGVLLVLRPDTNVITLSILLPFYIAVYNSFIFILVGKYSNSASSLGFTFYHIIFLVLFSFVFLFFDPIFPLGFELILFLLGGVFLILSILFWTAAFYIAKEFISIISPFFFTQIIWATIFGVIFFNEKINYISVLGILIIIISGTIAILNTTKKLDR